MPKQEKRKYHREGDYYVDQDGQEVDPSDVPPDLKNGVVFGFEYGPITLTDYFPIIIIYDKEHERYEAKSAVLPDISSGVGKTINQAIDMLHQFLIMHVGTQKRLAAFPPDTMWRDPNYDPTGEWE